MQKLALRPRLSSPHLEPRGFVEERRESARACARAAERCCLSRKVIISVGSAILHQPPWLRRPRCSLASPTFTCGHRGTHLTHALALQPGGNQARVQAPIAATTERLTRARSFVTAHRA